MRRTNLRHIGQASKWWFGFGTAVVNRSYFNPHHNVCIEYLPGRYTTWQIQGWVDVGV